MTNSIDLIRANNGANLASSPRITALRSAGSTTIAVTTVTGLPASFIAEMGTPDLVTGLISNGVVFRGHVSTDEIIIDEIGVGYTDTGSAVNDIVVLKPTAEWANNIADTLEVSHNDDGTLKSDIVTGVELAAANGEVINFSPAGNTEYSNAAMGDWITGIGDLTVPTWATKARVSWGIARFYVTTTAGVYNGRIKIGTAVGGNRGFTTAANPVDSAIHFSFVEEITLAGTGTQAIVIQAEETSGGALRATTATDIYVSVEYLP
jgi:hypothetical protein